MKLEIKFADGKRLTFVDVVSYQPMDEKTIVLRSSIFGEICKKLRGKTLTREEADLIRKEIKEHEAGEKMNFSEAVKALKIGNKVRRLSWLEGDCLENDFEHNHLMKRTIDPTDFCGLTIEDVESSDWWIVPD